MVYLNLQPQFASVQLNGALADALGLDDAPDVEWECDTETVGGWVTLWVFSEPADDVARYLQAHYAVDASVSHGPRSDSNQPGTWVASAHRDAGDRQDISSESES